MLRQTALRPGMPFHLFSRCRLLTAIRSSSFQDRKSTRLNSSHLVISYAVFCLKKKRYPSTRALVRAPASSPRHWVPFARTVRSLCFALYVGAVVRLCYCPALHLAPLPLRQRP